MQPLRAPMTSNGPEFSRFIAGFWRLNAWNKSSQQLLAFVEQCIELGVTTMDHAMVYRSEEPFGSALALKPALRHQLEIVTKCGIRPAGFGTLGATAINHYDSSAEHIIASTEQSLRALQTDYIDLLLIHRPDYLMQTHEVSRALETLLRDGKVRSVGASNFSTSQVAALQAACDFPLVTNQVECSPYAMHALDNGVFDQCQQLGSSAMLWSCLAGGTLLQEGDDKATRIMQAVRTVQQQLGAEHPEQIIYAWLLALPVNAYPILGTSNIERVRHAVASAQYTLNREQWYALWEASNGAPVP